MVHRINYNELYTDTDVNTGEDIFYLDEMLKVPFSGVVVDYSKGILTWEFDVKDGYMSGIERKYYDTGELMEENNVEHNAVDGLAKEYYKNGRMKSMSIVIRNVLIDSILYDEYGNILSKISIDDSNPSYFLIAARIGEYREKYRICEFE